ncbi:MAG: hypothetical protein LC798_17680 [Chloroflexi bacterium]|nr:hypothetical protein [Chloroflexota bacterium]
MPGLTAGATLELWEQADHLPPIERAIVLAAAADPVSETTAVARLPLGRRDGRLLHLRAELTSRPLDATAACPACGERVEFDADADALAAMDDGAPASVAASLEVDGFRVTWRPPDSDDVMAASAAGSAGDAEEVLLGRCVSSAAGPDGAVDPPGLPRAVRDAVSRAMAEADPLAEVVISLTCPACATTFDADLDIAAFVWTELRARARLALHEVAVLARAFGWTEAQVLALPERRRQAYLDLVRGEFA